MADTLPFWGPAVGTLAAAGNSITLECPGSTGANISLNGTWTGDVSVMGSTDALGAVQGSRIAYKQGVGSSGISTITGTGALVKKEFPILSGGQRVIVMAAANFVGSVSATIIATPSPSIIGVSGPVHTAEEEAIRSGRGFTFATGIQTVGSGEYLNVIVKNPLGSNVKLFFRRRYFFTDRTGTDTPMTFSQLSNPVDPGLTFVQGSNLQTAPSASPAPMSNCTFGFNVSATHIDTSPPTANPVQAIINLGQPFIIDTERLILQGASLGIFIPGVGAGANKSNVEFLCNWYEEIEP